MKTKKWITNNFGLKLLSLFLAIATWFYITSEFNKLKEEEEQTIFSMLQYDVVSKVVPIQLTIIGEVKKGYRIATDMIAVEPDTLMVVGPEKILNDVKFVRTVPLDVSEYDRNININLELAPIARGIAPKGKFTKVHIPIEKKETAGK